MPFEVAWRVDPVINGALGYLTVKSYSSKKRILDLGDSLLNLFSRPLAKLSKAVKVADTGNQGKAESKALSAVTVTLRKDTESFKKTDGVFNKDTFS